MKLYITGGGTGGHVTPGLAIARYFEKKQPQTTVRFAGSARGIENKLVPREGYPLDTIEIIGMSRSMSPKGILHNLKAAKLAVSAVSKAKKLLKQAKPDCVIGCGGYALIGRQIEVARSTAARHSDRAARGQRAARQGNADARKGRGSRTRLL